MIEKLTLDEIEGAAEWLGDVTDAEADRDTAHALISRVLEP